MKKSHFVRRIKAYVFLGLCLLCHTYLYGQGTVTGIIKDSLTNEPLIAANVFIKGTTTGTVTDYNGKYSIFLKEGDYILQISYLGYATEEVPFTIKGNSSVEINKNLQAAFLDGEEVIITAQARGQLAAVNRQLNSDQIINAVSSERIKEFPDDNAAQSISRLPGVHLSENSVVIRGLEPKMNKILINGVEMPSTDEKTRAVSLDMISSNMLSGIEVFKTVTPDMDADAIGGVVNLRLQEAPEGFRYSVLAQGTYNSQENQGSSKYWLDISNRILDNKIGISFNANYNVSNGGYDQVDSDYTKVTEQDDDSPYMLSDVEVSDRLSHSESYGGNIILDYAFNEGSLIFNSMLTDKVSESLTYTDKHNIDNSRRQLGIEHSEYTSRLWSNSLQFDKQLGRTKLDAAVSYISFKRDPNYHYKYDWETTQKSYLSDSLTNPVRMRMEPVDVYDYAIESDSLIASIYNNMYRWKPENHSENRINASLNIEIQILSSKKIDFKIKTGGKYMKLSREHDATQSTYGDEVEADVIHADFSEWLIAQGHENWESTLKFPQFRNYGYKTNDNFMNGLGYSMPYVVDVALTDKMATELIDINKLQVTSSSFQDDYWGGEKLVAGYFMAQLKLWNRLTLIPGVRYESMTYDYYSIKTANVAKGVFNVVDTLNKPATHNNVLPHLHSRFKVNKWFDVRFSFNQTLTRPDYAFIVPKLFYNTVAGTGYAGNPYLKPAVSTNYDLNFTMHGDRLGLITVGGFMKQIDDIFYSQTTLIKNIPDSSIINEFPEGTIRNSGETDFYVNNPNRAYLKGIELEWQSNFTFLPTPFNGIVLNTNYTRVWSETDYLRHRVSQVRITEPPYQVLVEDDTVFTGRLINQANDIANISVGYDYKGFSLRLSFRFQGNVITKVNSDITQNAYTDNSYKFDLALKQSIPTKFARLEVYFNAINFTNVPYSTYAIYPNKGETNTRLRYSGPSFQLGLRVRNLIK